MLNCLCAVTEFEVWKYSISSGRNGGLPPILKFGAHSETQRSNKQQTNDRSMAISMMLICKQTKQTIMATISMMLLCMASASHATSLAEQHRVTSLPGIDLTTLNATHFSGYLSVASDLAAINSFYYYVQHPDPDKPLLIWMNGGPGASSLMGLFTELGPLLLNSRSFPENNNGEWKLQQNPYSWSNEASLLVWEQPAGVGFSRCVTEPCPQWNDTSSASANLEILKAFYQVHPLEKLREVIIAGESYGGVYVPLLAANIHASSELIPLKGIAVGNGCVGYSVAGGCGTDAMDLLVTVMSEGAPGISRIVLSNTKDQCQEELNEGKQPNELSPKCLAAMQHLIEELGAYNEYSRGSPCGPNGNGNWGDGSGFSCGGDIALKRYLRNVTVQRALHVLPSDNSSVPLPWQWWDGDSPGLYNISNPNIIPTYAALLEQNYQVLIYNGLRDTGVPAQGVPRWLTTIGNGTLESRRKWSAMSVGGGSNQTLGDQVAGYVSSYGNGAKFATIIGAGHLSPGERPASAYQLISSLLRNEELPIYAGLKCKRLWLGRGYGQFC